MKNFGNKVNRDSSRMRGKVCLNIVRRERFA